MSIAKQAAAKKAADLVKAGMTVGLGTGSTAYWAIQELGKRVRHGLEIRVVASSIASEEEAKKAGMAISPFDGLTALDIYIDGADEVDAKKNLIKGGGGALLREKILAHNSKQFVVIVDEGKLVNRLGRFHVPIEIIPFAHELTLHHLEKLNGKPVLRMKESKPFVTDNGNFIADCDFGWIEDIAGLNQQLHAIPGVVETGLFSAAMVNLVIVGAENGNTRSL